jgi:hypothetical protein
MLTAKYAPLLAASCPAVPVERIENPVAARDVLLASFTLGIGHHF